MYRTHYRQYLSILVIVTVRHYYNIDIGNKLTAKWDWKLVLQCNRYCFVASHDCSHLFDLTIGFLLDEQMANHKLCKSVVDVGGIISNSNIGFLHNFC